MKILRYILFPIVPIYFLVTWLRNKFYDWGLFKSSEYTILTICVGNLSVGGTGKTPMIEYLIRLLKADYQLATLSRGYKRSTKGFVIADETATASIIGDEPFQFYNKFEDVIVSVDTDRRHGISTLMQLNNPPEVILLDDAFQHRKVKAKFNILLTSYDDLYVNDSVLPTGNLREPRSGAKRADVIVITKCPESISESDKKRIIKSLNPETYQQVFFSWIDYSDVIKNNSEEKELSYLSDKNFTLVTGIANSKPLLEFLEFKNLKFDHLDFQDHHHFTSKEVMDLKTKNIILTTEKDFMRLSPHFKENENIFYIPIELKIDRPKEFEHWVKSKTTLKM
ncbi:MAG: tetraacyldisaccharide 4'-kinase [Gelidibacter sp.]